LNKKNLADAIKDCLETNDPEGLIEVIEIYLDALEKSKFLKKARIPRIVQAELQKSSTLTTPLIKIVRVSDDKHPTVARSKIN